MPSIHKKRLQGATILITGGSGSWGHELVRQLFADYKPKEIRIYSRGELRQVEMKRRFQDARLHFVVGDVRDKDRLRLAMRGVDFVFHLAALKHVPVCEENPWEAVLTNVFGVQNIIDAAVENGVYKVVDVSTDKAVDPLNLYGVTKACGEKLFIASNNLSDKTHFVCVRGGNVLGTNGSVVPLFREQIQRFNGITITDEQMTRFFMRESEAIRLVLHATQNSIGGEVFVMKMSACKITDLADVMIKALGNSKTEKKIIGSRPGEKMHEVLVSRYESSRTYAVKDYFVVLPQITINGLDEHYTRLKLPKVSFSEFTSENTEQLSNRGIHEMLTTDGWLLNVAHTDTFDRQKKIPTETHQALDSLRVLDTATLANYFESEGWIKKKKKGR